MHRSRPKEEDAAIPSPKKPLPDDSSNSKLSSTPPPSGSPPGSGDISPEQRERMENSKLEAEAKIIAKKFGSEKLGLSWMKALLNELKKPYMQEASYCMSPIVVSETISVYLEYLK